MNLSVNVGDIFNDICTDEVVEVISQNMDLVRVKTPDITYWAKKVLVQNWIEAGQFKRKESE